MPTVSYIAVGKIQKPHGIHGAFHFSITTPFLDEDELPAAFYIGEGSKIPFFIKEIKMTDDLKGIISFEEIDVREKAKEWVNSTIWLTEKDYEKYMEEPFSYEDWIGFTLHDNEMGVIGKIEEILEYPQQILAQTSFHNKEVLIPLAEELIEDIDETEKIIYIQCPKGLLDL